MNVECLTSTFPKAWLDIYQKIHVVFADYGIAVLEDCKASCDKRNQHIVECWNVFNSAVAAYNLGRKKEANVIIKYLKEQFKSYYGIDIQSENMFWIGAINDREYEPLLEQEPIKADNIVGSYRIEITGVPRKLCIITTLEIDEFTVLVSDFPVTMETITDINIDNKTYHVYTNEGEAISESFNVTIR